MLHVYKIIPSCCFTAAVEHQNISGLSLGSSTFKYKLNINIKYKYCFSFFHPRKEKWSNQNLIKVARSKCR